jgi:hypothetical protein
MTDILFAGNTTEAVTPENSKFYMDNRFDAADAKYSPDGQLYTEDGAYGLCQLSEPVLLGEEVWAHFTTHMYTVSAYHSDPRNGELCWFGESGNLVAKAAGVASVHNEGFKPLYGTDMVGGYNTEGSAAPWSNNATYVYDVHVKLDPVVGFVLIYIGGALASAYYGDTTIGGQLTQFDHFMLKSLGLTITGTIPKVAFSEILVSRQKTIGQRVGTLKPDADGDTADWTGSFANVNTVDVDDGTTIGTSTADAVHLLSLSDVDAALPVDLNISAVVTSLRATDSGTGTVNNLQHVVKEGGMETVSATHSLSAASATDQEVWETNPRTGLPWTVAELNALQMGMKAKA